MKKINFSGLFIAIKFSNIYVNVTKNIINTFRVSVLNLFMDKKVLNIFIFYLLTYWAFLFVVLIFFSNIDCYNWLYIWGITSVLSQKILKSKCLINRHS